MDCDALRDDQWERIKGFVPGGTKGKRGPRTDIRLDGLDVSGKEMPGTPRLPLLRLKTRQAPDAPRCR